MRSAAIDSLFTLKAVHNDGLHHAIHTRGLNLSRFTMNVAPIQLRSLWRLRTERVTEIIDCLPAAVFAVIPFIFFVVMAVGLVRWYTPVPFWDMWDAYLAAYIDYLDGNWRALFVQTNEHRIWFLDVLFYLDLTFFGGRSLLLVPFNGLLAVLTWAALAAVARHLLKDRPGLWPVTALALGPLCFSWLQEQNLSWGFQSQFFVAYLFPLAAFACLAMSFRPRGRAGSGGGERDPRWAGIRGLLRSFPGWPARGPYWLNSRWNACDVAGRRGVDEDDLCGSLISRGDPHGCRAVRPLPRPACFDTALSHGLSRGLSRGGAGTVRPLGLSVGGL